MKKLIYILALAVAAQVQTPLTVYQSAGSATGSIRMQERRTNGTNYTGWEAPQNLAANVSYIMPTADGTSGQTLTTSGGGVLSWASAAGAPFIDSTAIVKGSADATKLLAFEVDGLTTATTRTLTPQDASYTIAGTNIAQTFSGSNVFSVGQKMDGGISYTSTNTSDIGSTSSRGKSLFFENISVYANLYIRIGTTQTVQSGGTLNIASGATLSADSLAGQGVTTTVRDAAGTGTCTLVFTSGLKTGGTC